MGAAAARGAGPVGRVQALKVNHHHPCVSLTGAIQSDA
jgi:hypothetical protein